MTYLFPIIQYGTFLGFLLAALNQLFRAMYSSDERIYMKRRFINSLKSQQEKIVKLEEQSKAKQKFLEAGFTNMSEMKWLLFRIPIILLPFTYFLLEKSYVTAIVIAVILYFLTEIGFKQSLINFYLNGRKKSLQNKKEIELFTLFDLLKTDLKASNYEQVNAYHLVNESLPYFKDIEYVLVRFLSLWKKSPKEAGAVFHQELSGETATFIGDVLAKLHNMNRTDAVNLLEEQGEVFTYKRAEMAFQKEEKKRLMFFVLFFIAAFSGIAWFLYFTYNMISLNMNY